MITIVQTMSMAKIKINGTASQTVDNQQCVLLKQIRLKIIKHTRLRILSSCVYTLSTTKTMW